MDTEEFIFRKFHLEDEIREIDEMEARGENINHKPLYARDRVLHDQKGRLSYKQRRESLKFKLKKHLQQKMT